MTAPQDFDGIAIVGLACRFPGARDAAAFWRNICEGVESITPIAEADLEDAYDAATRANPKYVKARGILEDVDQFDAPFFGMHAREAELTDPQHRVLLETCWEALEDAGCDPLASSKTIGVFAGCSLGTYLLRHVLRDRTTVETFASDYQLASFPMLLGGGGDFLATRIAYKLNLRGPAMTVQSACSTSLLAVAQACQTLWQHQADIMLAGAVSITFPQHRGYTYQEGGMASRDGHCRTFDAAASGTVFGAGCGAVVLRRLADARADGDTIYAVIRGIGINNDGSTKVGYTAPSVEGQARAIAAAHRMSGFAAETIDYVECHGTATPLGDPIEIAALAKAFAGMSATGKRCALGSVKPNVGHLDIAAGMAGLIKTALAIRHGKLPPTLHFTAPNPRIDFASTPFFVNAALADWPAESTLRRAGVSAFGVGGTNVHAVLEGEPARENAAHSAEPSLLVLSARTENALAVASARLAAHLRTHPDVALADVAFTLQSGRRPFPRRRALTVHSNVEAVAKLESQSGRFTSERAAAGVPAVAFLFPGQGSQYVGMGRELYAAYDPFRAAVDRCAEIVRPHLDADLRALLYPETDDDVAVRALTATAVAQPAIFTIEYALAQLWTSLGIAPVAMLGHSVGEFVAATLAGVLRLEDALRLVTERGRLMQNLPAGAMLAVRLAETELAALLPSTLGIAALNSPVQSVVSGPHDDIAAFEAMLEGRGILCKRVATSHAFHSPMMDPVREPLAALVATMPLAAPAQPYVSTVTGRWIDASEAMSPAYWADHARQTVRFSDALETLIASGATALLEVGPGSALATNARQGAGREAGCTIVESLSAGAREGGDVAAVLDAVGRLWVAGAQPDWHATRPTGDARTPGRISLPSYPFERARYWIDAPAAAPESHAAAGDERIHVETNNVLEKPDSREAGATSSSQIERDLAALLEELSGERLRASDAATSFLELGFDSLFLGRFAQQLEARFHVNITFRQLLGELPSLASLAAHVLEVGSPPVLAPAASAPASAPLTWSTSALPPAATVPGGSTYEAVVREQLQAMQELMREQLAALHRSDSPASAAVETARPMPIPVPVSATVAANALPVAEESPTRFDAFRVRAAATSSELSARQRAHIDELIARVTGRTAKSKAYTQRYRAVLADPRVAAGFRSEWKEMVYPIVCERAAGSRLWDVDGNEYVDILNGFGQTAFGHGPGFVVDAVNDQMARGFAIGPQAELAGEVAELFCKMTGNERVTFCNTGSEAVMAAIRIARTVTGRDRIVVFSGAYHGQFDEVLVKGARTSLRSIPIAPGIPAGSVANVTVLPNATPESLAWIREHAADLAAIVVEPVQSRHPALQPKEFLQELRTITDASGTALVFDEVVTGFRMHPAGMQAVFGVRADLATYGKVVGGGMPIGLLAGKARFMDALDGGMWQYGDASAPEVPPTFFAGTFVRHPLVMAAVLAVLRHLDAQGPALQEALTARTAGLVRRLNADLERRGLASRIETYGSMFYFQFSGEERLAGLLYYHLRARGIYIQEGFPCFLTTAHDDADVETVVRAFAESLDELQSAQIFTPPGVALPSESPSAVPCEISLTEAQREIWLAAQLGDDASCAFNESVTLRLGGPLDGVAFAKALDGVIGRHEALRASYGPTGETMRIAPELSIACESTDVSTGTAIEAEAALARYVACDARTPFDLIDGPLVRGHLLRLSDREHAFVFTAHHIACDGWSMNVILGELAALYAAACSGAVADLPKPLAFSAYAGSLRERDPAESARLQAFWHEGFAQPVPSLDLPTDRPRAAIKSFNGATRSLHVDADRYVAVKKAGARNGCTLFVTLLAAYAALLGRLAGRTDVVVGVPAAGQAVLGDETLVGHCVDFLPVRTRYERDATFADLLARVKKRVLAAYEHQNYTFGTLVRTLAPRREQNRLPLTEMQFNLERLADRLVLPDLSVDVVPNPKAFVNFDVFFNVIESNDGLRIDCDYNTDLFDATTIDRWLENYRSLLDAIAADALARVEDVALRSVEPGATTSSVCNGPVHAYRQEATLAELFEAQVAVRPDAIAAACGEVRIAYAELDRRANRLAHHLRARVGGTGKRIAVSVDRSLDMLVVLLAILKAGCAYVPLDPKHPAARLRHILHDAGIAALVVGASADAALVPDGTPAVHLERDAAAISEEPSTRPAVERAAARLAYAIYTSGSTGVPKGVEVGERSVVNLLESMARRPGLNASDVLLAVTTISFDIAALELFLPLIVGATVVIAQSGESADGFRLLQRIQSSGATALQATPATWRMLLEAGFRSTRGFKMLCGGEALRHDLAVRLLEGDGELWNMYGPTETTIWSSCARIARGGAITAGTPIANTQFYVLDENDELVPRGSIGQLHIAGNGVAQGYVGRPDLTAEKFVREPFGAGRMYRTGDSARMLPGGDTEILGRIDQQVKLRGFRIELGEIETILAHCEGLVGSAVALREDAAGGARLVAYFVQRHDATISPAALRVRLAEHLPEYMIPSAWVRLGALPLSANGKLDRAALPAPDLPQEEDAARSSPQTPTEIALAKIWMEVLAIERIGTDDDLFALGADSIHLFQITARANRQGLRLVAKQLFTHRTLGQVARNIDLAEASTTGPGRTPGAASLTVLPRPAAILKKTQSSG